MKDKSVENLDNWKKKKKNGGLKRLMLYAYDLWPVTLTVKWIGWKLPNASICRSVLLASQVPQGRLFQVACLEGMRLAASILGALRESWVLNILHENMNSPIFSVVVTFSAVPGIFQSRDALYCSLQRIKLLPRLGRRFGNLGICYFFCSGKF